MSPFSEKVVRDRKVGEQNNLSSFSFMENGSEYIVKHPLIMGEIPLHEDGEVKVILAEETMTLTLGEYLQRLGISYQRYFREVKVYPDKDRQVILKDLHQEVVDKRTSITNDKIKEYTQERAHRHNWQQETARDHSPFFIKTINDLGLDGLLAKTVSPRHDYLDGIDELIEFDAQALMTGGQNSGPKVIIAIQRSFEDKEAEVVKDPIRFFPENPEQGPIFRVFLKEDLTDYMDNQVTFMQKLLDLRSKKAVQEGLSPAAYAKDKPRQGLPAVAKVLPGGVTEQIKRTTRVLNAIQEQLHSFLLSSRFQQQPLGVQSEIKRQAELLKMEDFLEAVKILEAEAA